MLRSTGTTGVAFGGAGVHTSASVGASAGAGADAGADADASASASASGASASGASASGASASVNISAGVQVPCAPHGLGSQGLAAGGVEQSCPAITQLFYRCIISLPTRDRANKNTKPLTIIQNLSTESRYVHVIANTLKVMKGEVTHSRSWTERKALFGV